MDGHFYIRAEVHALRQTRTIERLEYAFMVFASARLAVVERSTEHISATSEWMNMSQAERCHFFQRRSSISGVASRKFHNPRDARSHT